MSMKKLFRLTKDGISELKAELEILMTKRTVIADSIKTARELGDLAENAEYQSARQEQERNEVRIFEIENILRNAEVITAPKNDGEVRIGATVKLKSESGKLKEFQVVGTVEADPLSGKISDESPIGQALLGKKEGEAIEIKTPTETTSYKIVEIG